MLNVTITLEPRGVGKSFQDIDMTEVIIPALNQMALSIERSAKQVTPVDSGLLRSSIRTHAGAVGSARTIQTDTHYARYVHDGTRYMKARPFMKWGVDQSITAWEHGRWNVTIDKELRKRLITL